MPCLIIFINPIYLYQTLQLNTAVNIPWPLFSPIEKAEGKLILPLGETNSFHPLLPTTTENYYLSYSGLKVMNSTTMQY